MRQTVQYRPNLSNRLNQHCAHWLQLATIGRNWMQLAAICCNWLQLAAICCNWMQLAKFAAIECDGVQWLQWLQWLQCSRFDRNRQDWLQRTMYSVICIITVLRGQKRIFFKSQRRRYHLCFDKLKIGLGKGTAEANDIEPLTFPEPSAHYRAQLCFVTILVLYECGLEG